MIKLSVEEKDMLTSPQTSNAFFKVDEITFDCLLGKWEVSTSEHMIGTYVFSKMDENELQKTLSRIAATAVNTKEYY